MFADNFFVYKPIYISVVKFEKNYKEKWLSINKDLPTTFYLFPKDKN